MKPVDTQAIRQQLSLLPDSWADVNAHEGVTDTYYEVLMDRENYALWVNAPEWLADLCAEVELLRVVADAARAFVADTPDPDWPSIGADNLAELIAALDALDAGGEQ